MRKSLVLVFLFSVAVIKSQAQRELSNPLINSNEIIEKGVALHKEGKFKDAIALYLKVPQSDTSFSSVLHELILSYYADSNFVEAERYANVGLSLFPDAKSKWYGFFADIYDDTKRSELALSMYDSVLASNPYNYLVWFNKGITFFRQQKNQEAASCFQRCIIINPYYSSAHYYLGQLAMLKGNMVEAMLSFATQLNIAPAHNSYKRTISFLQTIAEVNTTANEYLQLYKPGPVDNFEEVQEILVGKVSLDKKYKLKADLEDQIVRQLQVVIEKLEYNANDKGFWMQYYVPLYKKIWDNNLFEPMIFNMFSELDIKNVKEYNQKEKKKGEVFNSAATEYLNEIRESQEIDLLKRKTTSPRYYIKNYLVAGKGSYELNAKNEQVVAGPWEFYYDNGRLKSKGIFAKDGTRTGRWQYFYDNGKLKEVTVYANDEANGESNAWSDNGILTSKNLYKNDVLDGPQKNWYYSGQLASEINYKAGKKDGPAKYYSTDGYLNTTTTYKNDEEDGQQTFYHANGKIASVSTLVKGVAGGAFTEYYDNGSIKVKGEIVDGKKTGPWKSYYIDGKPEEALNYVKGELDGESIKYFSNGKISTKEFYKRGEIDGIKQDFDDDGILFSESVYENGRLRDIKFLDKKAGILSQTTSRKGQANIAFFGPLGSKQSEGFYSKDGLAEGDFTYFFQSGKVSGKSFFKNGFREGKNITYHPNGSVSQEGAYKKNLAHGYFVNYYINGQVSSEGWYVDDDRQGTFIYYDLRGNITSKLYYLNDKVHGISEYYSPNGKVESKHFYDYGWFNKAEQYDSTAKLMTVSELKQGVGNVRFNHFNGKPYFESKYNYYQLNGPYLVHNGDGSKKAESYYKNGNPDSIYISWHPNGKIQSEGKYKNGEKEGLWNYYYFNGKLYESENYKNGLLDGKDVVYNEMGNKTLEYFFKEGLLEGEVKYFGDNDQLMVVFYYKHDFLLGYSYEDKTGTLLPMIPLVKGGGTADAFYKNGAKSVHIVFKESVADGDRTFYYSNGKQRLTGTRINNLDNGTLKIYYASGKIMKEENYYYGERHGSFKYYQEDGALNSHVHYHMGSLHGECIYYTAGKPTTYVYFNGQLEAKK